MSSFLSRLHTELRRARLTRRGATQRPKYLTTQLYKEYPRMERVILPAPTVLTSTLDDVLARRRSAIHDGPGIALSRADMGNLLGHSLRQHDADRRRNYPSGGALYPIETYVIATQTSGFEPGIFHYHPAAHALERLWALPVEFEISSIAPKSDVVSPSALIVFTSIWERSAAKYGDLSYLHAVLEAGHMSQNILLTATALGLETRPYAGFNDQEIIRLLDLDEGSEQPLHTITLSRLEKSTAGAEPENE